MQIRLTLAAALYLALVSTAQADIVLYRADLSGPAESPVNSSPGVGTAIGLGLGGLVGSTLGWRWAFLLVGAPWAKPDAMGQCTADGRPM